MAEKSLFWADQIAEEIVKKWEHTKLFITEMGVGASGIPHVGSAGDGVRSYVVNLAIKCLGKKSKFIAFSDDRDGLRKVPMGFPSSLEKEIGKPVSQIPDPFKCHKSFSLHMSSLLIDSFQKIGVEFEIRRGDEEYSKGTLDKETVKILTNSKKVGEIVKRTTGSKKFLDQLPYLPICKKCGRIYTTRAHTFLPKEKKIIYKCDQEFTGKSGGKEIPIKGCGYEGEAGIREGKLAWKVEFSARWSALDVNYEAYGKDILDSVRCNDAICREVLGREPPIHSFYEMFVERGGEKLSKSKGNVFTPQTWLEYASPESLRLLFLKRLGTTRVVDVDSIPSYMDEVDTLEKLYFGGASEKNDREVSHKRRLYEYVHFLNPPKSPGLSIGYHKLTNIARNLPEKGRKSILKKIVLESGIVSKPDKELDQKIEFASKWIEQIPKQEMKISLTKKDKESLSKLVKVLEKSPSGDDIQTAIFTITKEAGLKPSDFFGAIYQILLGSDRGPKAGHLIHAMGTKTVISIIKKKL